MILGRRDRARLLDAERTRDYLRDLEVRVDLVTVKLEADHSVTTKVVPVLVSTVGMLDLTRIYSSISESWLDLDEPPMLGLGNGAAVQIRLGGSRIL